MKEAKVKESRPASALDGVPGIKAMDPARIEAVREAFGREIPKLAQLAKRASAGAAKARMR